MHLSALLLCLTLLTAERSSKEKDEAYFARFPQRPPPQFVVVRVTESKESQLGLVVLTVEAAECPLTHVNTWLPRVYYLEDLVVFDPAGRQLSIEEAKKRLVDGMIAIRSADSQKVDSRFVEILKADTLILVPKRESR